jgi:ABC-type bacteriocin/lantibiotic exporter with double-glycine peptidase domain
MDTIDHRDLTDVRSREAQRFEYVDEQGADTSCGYAALASLLRLYRDQPVTEAGLMNQGSGTGGPGSVSLGRLAALARTRGLVTRAWRLGYDRLPGLLAADAPVLAHYDRPEGHFALVLAADSRAVVTADPARGLELLTRGQFLERWSGAILEVLNPRQPRTGSGMVEKAVQGALDRQRTVKKALASRP